MKGSLLMAHCIYDITSPDGELFHTENLAEFCKEWSLDPKGMSSETVDGSTYKGWKVERIPKALTVQNQMKKSGLSLDERVLRITDENTKLKQELNDAKRDSSIIKEVAEIIETIEPIKCIPPYKPLYNKSATIQESAILVLSDSHADQQILSGRVQGLEEYNFNVACKRGERIVDVTTSHLLENMKNYSFKTLYVFGVGDYVSGEIHGAKEHSQWKNSIKNSMATGELFAQMLAELAQKFSKIVFISVSGNHGRFSQKKDYRGAQENWDYLVGMHVKTRLQSLIENGSLDVVIPDAWSTVVNIEGWNFVLGHGDDIKSFSGLPFYGIERKTRRLMSVNAVNGIVPHYFVMGHFHQKTSLAHTMGEIFINGAWNATDEFALESLGAYTEPSQLLMGVHPKYGVSWRMPIRLRTDNWQVEEKKKSRYNVDMF